ncbi:MAG TPA: universal stress protein [Oligoflexus sp.]|uniref:universal stress protein n=1 Tax=Oligoflexus sp. TaxID=1971216 RepID=UPI002D7333FD|nr:universal stress protein [Oligoflexus sp.]HYX31750.1 universal stress protein [Oligoflexus sp.]
MPLSNQNHDTVIAGVKKEGASPDFIRKIRSFSTKTEQPIVLVHAIEEKLKFPSLYREILGSFDIAELGRTLPEVHEKEAREKIESLKSSLDDQELIRVQIVHSEDVAASLIAEAQLTRASLIAIEVSEHLFQLIPRGLSVALSLMQHAPMPVLMLRQNSPNRFEEKDQVLIIADDLSASSMGAVRKGMNLASQWGHTHVIHLHVIEQNMHGVLTELSEISRKVTVGPMGTPALLEYLEHHMEIALQRRTMEYQEALKKVGSTYEAVVQVGHVASKVSAMIRDRKPNLTVFGRRQRLHHGPFGFARVPFAAMLAHSDAVLIAP